MKTTIKFQPFIMILIAFMSLTSCLKDDPFMDLSNLTPIVEFPYKDRKLLQTFTSSEMQQVKFIVNLASAKPASKDISVTIAVDETRAAAYGAGYGPLTTAAYTITSNTSIIRKGNNQAEYTIQVNPANIPAGKWVVPIIITDAQGFTISGNFGHLYLELKN